jgi:hypothetical protein
MADPKNKWSQPVNPPAPMFFGQKERDLVKQVNDELAERVVGQTIAYYPISIEDSNFSDIYGEAIEKVSLPPVRVFAYVTVENEQTNDRYGYEYEEKLTVNFHRKRLTADQNLYVRVGDFIQYGERFYEIVRTYNDTRYYFGQVEHKFQITADCVQARAGNFQVMPGITRPVDTAVDTVDGSTAPEPRSAPYPPVDADYITLTRNTKLVNGRYLAAGTGITLTDGGRMSALTISAAGTNATGPTGSLQFHSSAGSFSGSSALLFLTASDTLSLTGDMSASVNISASAFYGDGSKLSGISATDSVFSTLTATAAYTTSSVSFGTSNTPDHTVSISGSLSASVNVSASSFYGDGSKLTGISAADSVFSVLDASNAYTTSSLNVGGTTSPSSQLYVSGSTHLSGALIHQRTLVSAATYTLLTTDYFVGSDTTSNTVTHTLPAAAGFTDGQTFVFKDEGGNASSNNIIISPTSPDTIDGVTGVRIGSNYGSINIYTDGVSAWYIY